MATVYYFQCGLQLENNIYTEPNSYVFHIDILYTSISNLTNVNVGYTYIFLNM